MDDKFEKEYINEWFQFGDNDLTVAELTLSNYPEMYEIICYHCQQSSEKYLKGFLFYHGVKPPKIHEIDTLCEICAKFDAGFDEIIKICAVLTMYGVTPRYPYEAELDESNANQAIEYARQIKDFAPLVKVRDELETSDV